MSTGSNRYIQYVKQSSPKVLPSPANFTKLRTTGGSGLMNNRTNITSNEIRDDRQIIVSRLGQNQPDTTIPFELSYESFDDFMQGALGGEWVGGQNLTANATMDIAGVITLATGEWADYAIAVGDFVLLNATGNTNVIAKVGAIGTGLTADELTLVDVDDDPLGTADVADAEDFSLITGHYAAKTGTDLALAGTIAVVASTFTMTQTTTGTTFGDLGVEVGDKVFFAGFSEENNNGWHKVTAIDTTGKILTLGDSTLTDESAPAADVSLVTSTGFITVGKNLDFYAVEEGFTDVTSGTDINGGSVTEGVYHHSLGNYVSSMNMSVQPDSIITGEFAFQALTYSGFVNASVASAVQESNINQVLDSFTGNLLIPDAPDMQGVVTGLDFTLDNGLNRRYALMDKDAISIGDGRSTVTGSLNAYFENADVSNLFENETEFVLSLRSEDLDGNSYTFGWPRVKLNSDSRDVTENDVTSSFGFAALGGLASEKKKTMYILKQPVIA